MARKRTKIYFDTEFIEDGHTIDLISIGMVDDEGNEFYAISSEFDETRASDWVKANVLVHLPSADVVPRHTNYAIRDKVLSFVGDRVPQFWAYYASYDHVVLAQLFGKMIDLPDHFPKFTMDIKQLAVLKGNPRLPAKRDVVHDALEDAKWNKEAHELLMSVDFPSQ